MVGPLANPDDVGFWQELLPYCTKHNIKSNLKIDKKSENIMHVVTEDENRVDRETRESKSTIALITSMDVTEPSAARQPVLHNLSELSKREDSERVSVMSVLDGQLRTPTSEYPSTVPTPATSWTSQELPQTVHDSQSGNSGSAQQLVSQNGCYFTTRAGLSSDAAEIHTTPSTTTWSSESRTSSVGDRLDSVSAPQSPGGRWRDFSSQNTPDDTETPRPTSLPIKRDEAHSRNRPNYPNQSFAALQAQYIPQHYPRPHPLRTRSSHPSQHQSYLADVSRRSRELSSMSVGAKTAGNTPAQSPGLFSPTFSPNRSAAEHEDGQYNTPLLHPSHMQAPKESVLPHPNPPLVLKQHISVLQSVANLHQDSQAIEGH